MNKETLIVNLFGAPGSGKSTGATYLFSNLKMMQIDCQYISEFAKDKCWQNNSFMFQSPENQFYIGAKQFYRVNQLNGKVDIAITDSPIFLNSFYNKSEYLGEEYNIVMLRLFNKFNNVNFFLNRVKKYNENGRNQKEEQANKIAVEIKQKLNINNIQFQEIPGNKFGYGIILNRIVDYLKKQNKL